MLFSFSFSCLNLKGIIQDLTKGGGKCIGRLAIYGPRIEMWTNVREMMNGGIVSGKGVVCAGKGAGPRTQSQGFSSSTTLEPNGQ